MSCVVLKNQLLVIVTIFFVAFSETAIAQLPVRGIAVSEPHFKLVLAQEAIKLVGKIHVGQFPELDEPHTEDFEGVVLIGYTPPQAILINPFTGEEEVFGGDFTSVRVVQAQATGDWLPGEYTGNRGLPFSKWVEAAPWQVGEFYSCQDDIEGSDYSQGSFYVVGNQAQRDFWHHLGQAFLTFFFGSL